MMGSWLVNVLEKFEKIKIKSLFVTNFFTTKNIFILNIYVIYVFLNIHIDGHHFSNITKLRKKKTLPTLSPSNMWLVLSMKNRSFGNICYQRKEFLACHLLLSIASIPQLLTCSFVEGYKEMAWSPYKNMHGTQKRFSL